MDRSSSNPKNNPKVSSHNIENTKVTMVSKSVQVSLGACMIDEECAGLQSETYWKSVAEKKCIELKDALDKNERLNVDNEVLLKENLLYKTAIEEVSTLISVMTEIVLDTTYSYYTDDDNDNSSED